MEYEAGIGVVKILSRPVSASTSSVTFVRRTVEVGASIIFLRWISATYELKYKLISRGKSWDPLLNCFALNRAAFLPPTFLSLIVRARTNIENGKRSNKEYAGGWRAGRRLDASPGRDAFSGSVEGRLGERAVVEWGDVGDV